MVREFIATFNSFLSLPNIWQCVQQCSHIFDVKSVTRSITLSRVQDTCACSGFIVASPLCLCEAVRKVLRCQSWGPSLLVIRDPHSSSIDPNVCTDGFSVKGDTCFWREESWFERDLTWDEASEKCKAKGAKLYIAPTEEEKYNLLGNNYCFFLIIRFDKCSQTRIKVNPIQFKQQVSQVI